MFDGTPEMELAPEERRARLRLARSARIAPSPSTRPWRISDPPAPPARPSRRWRASIEREEAALAAQGGRFLVFGDAHYPAALAALPDAPPVLSALGDPAWLARPMLAIVGARDASLAGRRFAADLSTSLGRQAS